MTQNKLPKKNKFFKAKKLDSLILTQQSLFLVLNTKMKMGTHKQAETEDGCSKNPEKHLKGRNSIFGDVHDVRYLKLC